MLCQKKQISHLLFHKIHFSIRKRVKFGQAIYVCGHIPELGLWQPQKAFKLKWNESDLWTGTLLITNTIPSSLEYKYIIADYYNPSSSQTEWEVGSHNRQMDLDNFRPNTICDDRWNMDKITLLMMSTKGKPAHEEKYYVTGDISELGSWKQKKSMKKIPKRHISQRKQNIGSKCQEDMETYTFTFYTFRGKEHFYYYYIKKGEMLQSERKPGRVFHFGKQKQVHPYRRQVSHNRGEIVILDECNINELIFSKITNRIFVGSYPRSSQDILRLKERKITSILSIQSQRDFNSHGLSPHFMQLICNQAGIKYRRYAIQDMNNEDFIDRAEGAVKIMNDLMKEGGSIYVHCSAGIYRSPQIIALYLTLFQSYSIEEAVEVIKDNHPYAKPNSKVINDAIGLMRLRQRQRRVSSF